MSVSSADSFDSHSVTIAGQAGKQSNDEHALTTHTSGTLRLADRALAVAVCSAEVAMALLAALCSALCSARSHSYMSVFRCCAQLQSAQNAA